MLEQGGIYPQGLQDEQSFLQATECEQTFYQIHGAGSYQKNPEFEASGSTGPSIHQILLHVRGLQEI